jgi:proline iminopeptidase
MLLLCGMNANAQPAKPSPAPATQPPPKSMDERLNLHPITPEILGGGAPQAADMPALAKEKNIKRVICLLDEAELPPDEAKAAEAAGMTFTHIPIQTPGKTPADIHLDFGAMKKTLDLLSAPGEGVTFLHCKTGTSRVGAVNVAYQVLVQKKGFAPALRDAIASGFRAEGRPNFLGDLKKLIAGVDELPVVVGIPITDAELNNPGEMVNVGGQRLNVKKNGDGPPVYVLHGGPGETHKILRPYLDALSKQYTLVYYDQRGCGKSSKPQFEEAYSLDRLVQELDGLREALKHEKISLIAQSSGVAVAIKYALAHRDRVDKLVLASGWASAEEFGTYANLHDALVSGQDLEILKRMFQRLPREGRQTFNDAEIMEISAALYPLDFFGTMSPEFRKDWNRRAECSSLTNHALSGELFKTLDLRPELPKLSGIPTLVLAGKYDVVVPPETVNSLATGIPGAQLVVFQHSGHYHFVEENDLWMKTVAAFLAGQALPAE